MILSREELQALTGRRHSDAQVMALRRLGVPFKLDGRRPVVLRSAVEVALGGSVVRREPQLRP